jgi:hypothetical protein
MAHFPPMHMDMHMPLMVMQMFVTMNLVLKSAAESPNTDANQHHPPVVRPGREQREREQLAEQQQEESYREDATGMARTQLSPVVQIRVRCATDSGATAAR